MDNLDEARMHLSNAMTVIADEINKLTSSGTDDNRVRVQLSVLRGINTEIDNIRGDLYELR